MKATMQTAMLNLNEQIKKMGANWYWVRCERGYLAYRSLDKYDASGRMKGSPTMLEQIFIGTTASTATAWVAKNNA